MIKYWCFEDTSEIELFSNATILSGIAGLKIK